MSPTGKIVHATRKRRNQKDYSHPSVIALIQEAGGETDPESIVRKKCRRMVSHAKKFGWGSGAPPFCPFLLASILGIKVREVHHDIGAEARIFGTKERVFIEYREDLALPERLRFSIFHEIVHTIFPDCYDSVRYSNQQGLSEAEREFERLCDVGASELLFPLEEFGTDLGGTEVHLDDVWNLKKRYEASVDATVKRCVDLTSHPCAAIFLHVPPNEEIRPSNLGVKFYWKSSSFRPFIKPGSIPPKDSVVHTALIDGSAEAKPSALNQETWWSDGRPVLLRVQAIPLPAVPRNPEYPKVMALVSPR